MALDLGIDAKGTAGRTPLAEGPDWSHADRRKPPSGPDRDPARAP